MMRKILITLMLVVLLATTLAPPAMALKFPDADTLFSQDPDEKTEVDPENDTRTAEEKAKDEQTEKDRAEFEDESTRREAPIPTGNLLTDILPQAIRLGLFAMGIVIFVSLSYAGVLLVISRGEEDAMTKVKDMIIHIVIGVAVVGAAFAVVAGVIRVIANL